MSAAGNLFPRFCRAIDAEQLLQNPDYDSVDNRSKNRDALNAEIQAILISRSAAHWVELLNEAGVPCGPVYTINEAILFALKQL